jgi:hypothetical protein
MDAVAIVLALERVLGPVERGFYRVVRTSPDLEQDWKQYGRTSPPATDRCGGHPSRHHRVLQLVQQRQPVGRLIVTFRQGQWIPPVIRLALATVAHALATATGPAVSHDQ